MAVFFVARYMQIYLYLRIRVGNIEAVSGIGFRPRRAFQRGQAPDGRLGCEGNSALDLAL